MKESAATTVNDEVKNDAPEISDSELEAIMSGTALDALLEEETTETEATDDLLEAAVEAVENDEAKAEAYEEQDKTAAVQPEPDLSAVDLSELVEEEAKKETVKPKRKRRSKKKAPVEKAEPAEEQATEEQATEEEAEPTEEQAKPTEEPVKKAKYVRVPTKSHNGMKPSEVLKSKLGDDVYKVLITSKDKAERSDVDEILNRIDTELPVKVVDKMANLTMFIAGKAQLSVFTVIMFDLLKEQNGTFTFEELKQAYLNKPYSKGTAAAQAGHAKWLLDISGICDREPGYKFVLRQDSVLWQAIQAIMNQKQAA